MIIQNMYLNHMEKLKEDKYNIYNKNDFIFNLKNKI